MGSLRRKTMHKCKRPKVKPWWGTFTWSCSTASGGCGACWVRGWGTGFLWYCETLNRRERWEEVEC